MNDDPTIRRIREARHRISKQFDHDPKKLVAYYIKRQQEHAERLAPKSRSAQVEQDS